MRPPVSFIGQPVRSLQTMLRVIAEQDDRQPSVIPDGIYGPQTSAAVSAFQRSRGLPVTGVADELTWDAVVAAYEPALVFIGEAQPLQIVLDPNQIIRAGEANPNLYIVQGILAVLSQQYTSITPPGLTGVLDVPTRESLSAFQQLSQLPDTGELDRQTWRHLALQYPAAANLSTRPKKRENF